MLKRGIVIMFEEYGDMLTVDEVAEILGVGKNSAYEIFRSGKMNCFMLKGKWKIPKQALIEYIHNLAYKK